MVLTKKYCRKSILFLLCLVCFSAYGDEYNQPTYEYMQIFRSIPAVFEYFLDVLEQRPEILERNDVAVFKRNLDEGTGTRGRRSYDADNRNDYNKMQTRDYITNDVLKYTREVEADAMATEYVNGDITMDPLMSKEDEIETYEGEGKPIVETNSIRKVDNGRDMYWGDRYFGFDDLFSLDYKPEDVVEQIVRIDQLLAKHNAKKDL